MAGSLLVVSGPPGAGKSTVAGLLADEAEPSVLVEGDRFFGFLSRGAIEPWLPAAEHQNTVVISAAAAAAGQFANAGFATVYDGLIGPWFVPTFGASTGLDAFDCVVLLPPVDSCVQRVLTRQDHGFRDEDATRKMHDQFVQAAVDERHVLVVDQEPAAEVAAMINVARVAGALRVDLGSA